MDRVGSKESLICTNSALIAKKYDRTYFAKKGVNYCLAAGAAIESFGGSKPMTDFDNPLAPELI